MLKKWIVCLLGALAFSQATAGEKAPESPKQPVQLSDAELDQITAGGVLAVIILTPGKGSHFSNAHERTILIQGLGKDSPAAPSHTIIKAPKTP